MAQIHLRATHVGVGPHIEGNRGLTQHKSVLSWVVLAYTLLAEKLPTLRSLHNVFAVLSLDLFMTIMWLAAMGTNAAHTALFTVPVNIAGCYDDGSLIDSTTCYVVRKRSLVAGKAGMGVMKFVCVACALML